MLKMKGKTALENKKYCAHTFNDGPSDTTPNILDLPKLIDEGYNFVNIRKLFGIKGIDPKSLVSGQWKDVVKA